VLLEIKESSKVEFFTLDEFVSLKVWVELMIMDVLLVVLNRFENNDTMELINVDRLMVEFVTFESTTNESKSTDCLIMELMVSFST